MRNAEKSRFARGVMRRLIALRLPAIALTSIVVIYLAVNLEPSREQPPVKATFDSTSAAFHPTEKWLQRAYAIDELYHGRYTPCWEGAYGAIGDAYLFAATRDSSLLRFHLIDHDLQRMCTGRWVDDRAWICLAEILWWEVTNKTNMEYGVYFFRFI